MPVPTTTADFLTLVRKSGFVEPAALEALAQRLAADPGDCVAPKALAQRMVREGLLTVLQAGQLLRGKWRNFVIRGKYRLLEHLGTGGMGRVYLCEHILMGRRVAVKILAPERADDPVCRRRFEREAKAAAVLDHPNIVRAHDFDREGRLLFIVMEYVDGASLQEIVRKAGPLSVGRACDYVRQAALGLQHAHQAGLVHRDIKPSNLLLDRSGTVKILDMGLARFSQDRGDNLSRNLGKPNLIGTADYLAPEQALDSHAATIRSDIYSLGATFYYLLTAHSLFKDGTVAQKLIFHQVKMPEPVRAFRPDVPDALARVVHKMLAKLPAERYQTPQELLAALESFTGGPVPPPPESEMPRLSRAARRLEPSTHPLAHSSRSTLHGDSQPVTPGLTPAAPDGRLRLGRVKLAAFLRAVGGKVFGRLRKWRRTTAEQSSGSQPEAPAASRPEADRVD
jgi:serine/threonine protein kinase